MRKVRDYDAELKALETGQGDQGASGRTARSAGHRHRGRCARHGTLAGALLDAVAMKDAEAKEAWRAKGAAFFQRGRKAGRTAGSNGDGAGTQSGADPASGSGPAS
jgi:hypothetical protein